MKNHSFIKTLRTEVLIQSLFISLYYLRYVYNVTQTSETEKTKRKGKSERGKVKEGRKKREGNVFAMSECEEAIQFYNDIIH